MEEIKVIDSFDGKYDFLSNFYPYQVYYEGAPYPSVEHAYQAAKAPPEERELFTSGHAAYAKRLGRGYFPDDWHNRKVRVMSSLLQQKFSSESCLAQLLLDTGSAQIIEGNTWGDTFWGVCKGVGSNMLGKLLMQERAGLYDYFQRIDNLLSQAEDQFDFEAVGWAYKKCINFGLETAGEDSALMMDRLKLLLETRGVIN